MRDSRRRLIVPCLILLVCMVFSGCTAVGTVAGFLAGAATGSPEAAVAGAEAGMYIGAAIDISIIDAVSQDDYYYNDDAYEWYAEGYEPGPD